MLFQVRKRMEKGVRLFVLLIQIYKVAAAMLESINTGPVFHVHVVEGLTAELPCDVQTPDPNDKVILVLWYKDAIGSSIYTYESRKNNRIGSRDWSDEKTIGGRAHFDLSASPSALVLEDVMAKDEGLYRCRVDFKKSPTRIARTNLTVIIPPKDPPVIKKNGVQVWSTVGPYDEGDSLKLICDVSGGKPPPQLTWWLRKGLIDNDYRHIGNGIVRNTLMVYNLTREHLHALLSCQASNSNNTAPLDTSITIEMNFKPLTVRFLGSGEPLSAGKHYELECQSVGARPPAVITWLLDGVPLTNVTSKSTNSGNVSLSVLHFTPKVGDGGKLLTCSAKSPVIEHEALTDHWQLKVFYTPILKLNLGHSLNPDSIKEKDDVYFECQVKANPKVYKIVWYHKGIFVQQNVSAGVIMSNQSLVIQKVKREQAGLYTCVASNLEGDGQSNALKLNVQYAPVCAENQVQVYGAARYEKVTVTCKLDSVPPVTSFSWRFNNSGDVVEIAKNHVLVEGQESSLSYVAKTELDYGTLLCWGSNSLGKQIRPCSYIVIPAGPPDGPSNCSVANESATILHVKCQPGYDGGVQQSFVAEVYDEKSYQLRLNMSVSSAPDFQLAGLEPGKTFKVIVYSTNSKGPSEKWVTKAYTIKDIAEKRTAQVRPPPEEDIPITPLLAVGVGVAGSLLLVVLVAVVILRLNKDKRKPKQKALNISIHTPIADTKDLEEINPDVIPNGGSDQEGKSPTTPEDGGFKTAHICASISHYPTGSPATAQMYSTLPRNRPLLQSPCQNPEVMYAELAFPRVHYTSKTGSLTRRKQNPTVYAQIDHPTPSQELNGAAVLPLDSSQAMGAQVAPSNLQPQQLLNPSHISLPPNYICRDSSIIPIVTQTPAGGAGSSGIPLPYRLQDGVPASLGIPYLSSTSRNSQSYEGVIPPPALPDDEEVKISVATPLMSDTKESSV